MRRLLIVIGFVLSFTAGFFVGRAEARLDIEERKAEVRAKVEARHAEVRALILHTPDPSDPPPEVGTVPSPAPSPEPARPSSEPAGTAPTSGPDLVRRLWPGANKEEAVRIVACESNFNAGAVGRASEKGWYQIHPVHRDGVVRRAGHTWEQMFDPAANTAVAWQLYVESGHSWRHWSCRP